MNEKLLFKESVRGIVEYVLKSGSLDDRFVSRGRAVDGTIAHGKLQKDNTLVYEDYEKETGKHIVMCSNGSIVTCRLRGKRRYICNN